LAFLRGELFGLSGSAGTQGFFGNAVPVIEESFVFWLKEPVT
jgi:hypothetical protein